MKWLWLLLWSLAGLAGADGMPAARPASPSLQAVEAALAQSSPQATLAKFFDCRRFRGTAYERIADGSLPWIGLAQRMLEHSDGCYTEGILSALGQAMVRAPRHVLPLVQSTPLLAANKICLPFISDELPPATQRAAVRRSRLAIERVADAGLQKPRAACIEFIASVEASLNAVPPARK